jgi:hypothetical protein
LRNTSMLSGPSARISKVAAAAKPQQCGRHPPNANRRARARRPINVPFGSGPRVASTLGKPMCRWTGSVDDGAS